MDAPNTMIWWVKNEEDHRREEIWYEVFLFFYFFE